MEIEGKIVLDLPMQSGISRAGTNWKKKEWVMETPGTYPRKVMFTVFGDRADTLTFQVGKDYVVQVDVESREFNGRWFTNLNAYAARELQSAGGPGLPEGYPDPYGQAQPQPGMYQPAAAAPAPAAPAAPVAAPVPDPFAPAAGNENEDLPF